MAYNTRYMQKRGQDQLTQVSEKNTKTEIMEAYKKLLSELNENEDEEERSQTDETIVTSAAHETIEKITNDLSQLRLSANQTINTLTEQLTHEAERFASVKKAIVIVQKELEETQKVKIKATQLYQMIALQKKDEEAFTMEMVAKRTAWEEEQNMYTTHLEKERTRENEEYEYNKKLQRKRDSDVYEEEKRQRARTKEEETKERTSLLKELEELRDKVLAFPLELEKETKRKVSEAVANIQREAHVQQTLVKQEADAKLSLAVQRIASLEFTITSLMDENKEFKQQLEKATNHIKDIAVSVVEGTRKETLQQIRTSTDTGTK